MKPEGGAAFRWFTMTRGPVIPKWHGCARPPLRLNQRPHANRCIWKWSFPALIVPHPTRSNQPQPSSPPARPRHFHRPSGRPLHSTASPHRARCDVTATSVQLTSPAGVLDLTGHTPVMISKAARRGTLPRHAHCPSSTMRYGSRRGSAHLGPPFPGVGSRAGPGGVGRPRGQQRRHPHSHSGRNTDMSS